MKISVWRSYPEGGDQESGDRGGNKKVRRGKNFTKKGLCH